MAASVVEASTIPMSKHVVIIGGGPGGLAAAMLLASRGVRVTLLEKRDVVGGRTSTLTLDDSGYKFDLGPTFFLYPEVLEEVFRACGRKLREEVEMIRLDPQYRLLFEGADGEPPITVDATPDLKRMRTELAKLDAGDAANMERFIAENRVKFDAFKPILQRPWHGWGDLLRPGTLAMLAKMLPLVRPWASVDTDLKRYFKDPRTRLAFSFQSKYLGMSPFRCPSLFTILSYLEYDFGVFHPVGGCGAVSEAMARIAVDIGVDLRLEDPVEEVLLDERGRAVGVRSSSGEHHADAVIVNADFAHAMSHLVPDKARRRWTDAKLAAKKYSCSTFMMYLGVEGTFEHIAHHTIFLAHDYGRNLDEIENQHILSDNPSVYVHNPCVTDATLAPRGCSSLYVLAPVSHLHPNIDWSTQSAGFRRRVLGQLGKMGLPDVEGRIVCERTLTPREWEGEMGVYRGATFNLAHNLKQMLHLRPRNRFEDIPGMYLVGGGTHPGSGLPVIYESARITAKLVLEDLGVDAGLETTLPTPRRSEAGS